MATAKKTVEAAEEKAAVANQPLKSVTFSWNGSMYTLEFSRETAQILERQYGFSLTEMQSGKVSYLPDMFRCALLMHHPNMKQSTADTLYNLMEDKQALMMALTELYANGVNSLLEDPEEGKGISWTRH